MKLFLSCLFLILTLVFVSVSPVLALTPEEAATKEGETVSVTSRCSNSKKTQSGSLFINFGGDYPNQTFSVFISKTSAEAFGSIDGFSGKTYTVTGVVKLKNGKPEMQITTPDQLVSTPAEGDSVTPASTPAAK